MNEALVAELLQHGVVVRHRLPRLRSAMDWSIKRGELRTIVPGILAAADQADSWQLRVTAACHRFEDAVITGEAAAALGYWPQCAVRQVAAYHGHRVRAQGPIAWHRLVVPPEWVLTRGALRFSRPAWTAVDLCGTGDATPLDQALRAGVPLADLWRALEDMPGRPGNTRRRLLLRDSRDQPWSAAERLAHRHLRGAGITGWRTNHRWRSYYLDIAWPGPRVCLEVDGYEFHSDRTMFESDRLRDQLLLADGWLVLRVTYRQLLDDREGVLRRVRQVLRSRGIRETAEHRWHSA